MNFVITFAALDGGVGKIQIDLAPSSFTFSLPMIAKMLLLEQHSTAMDFM